MKIRIKFNKLGPVRYIGHLDVMRYFQKLNRRAGIDVKYSAGFSPHQIMSFASPLGVGLESLAEYVDLEVNSTMNSENAIEMLNNASVDGIQILSYVRLPDNCKNAMSSVAAADYNVHLREEYLPEGIDRHKLAEEFKNFLNQDKIMVVKESKKSVREIDLKPHIYESGVDENGDIFLKLAAGSVENIKPELVIEAFFSCMKTKISKFALDICRVEVYGFLKEPEEGRDINIEDLIPLEKFGEVIE